MKLSKAFEYFAVCDFTIFLESLWIKLTNQSTMPTPEMHISLILQIKEDPKFAPYHNSKNLT